MLRKPRSPPGPSSSICFHGDLGLVFNLTTGERLRLLGSSKVPIKFASTSVRRRWHSDLRRIIPSFFYLPFTWIETAGFFVIISWPWSSIKSRRNDRIRTGQNKHLGCFTLQWRNTSFSQHIYSFFLRRNFHPSPSSSSSSSYLICQVLQVSLELLWRQFSALQPNVKSPWWKGPGIGGVISEVAAPVVCEPIAPMSKHTECAQPSEKRLRRTPLPQIITWN